jgi:DTW domain-containing protein YfiP
VIVRHHWEAWKSTGTARLAALALSNLRIVDMAAENPEPVRATIRALAGAWFLYPGGESSPPPMEPPQTLVVLDGTWRQTRKMLRRLPELSLLPRFSLPPVPEHLQRARLRAPPRPGARSTFESIADALSLLRGAEAGERLLDLHALFVRRTLEGRSGLPAAELTDDA